MEASYGVGVANRYALLMDDDEIASAGHAKGGKENKDTTTKSKNVTVTGKSTAAPSNKQNVTARNASSGNTMGNKAQAGKQQQQHHQQQQQQHQSKHATGKVARGNDAVNNNSIHAVNNNQVNQGKFQRNQPPAANDAAKQALQAPGDDRQPRLDHRGQARDRPRQDRPPRQPATESHGNGPARDSDEARKNRRNRDERGPLQLSNFTSGEGNTDGAGGEGRSNRGPRNPKFFKGDRPPRTGDRIDRGDRGDRNVGERNGPRGPRSFGSDNRDGRGKPVFDRHSGSDKAGIKPVEKRDGAGAHNWGTYNDDIEGQAAPEEPRNEKANVEESTEQGEAHTDGEVEPAKEVEDEGPKEMTLEEYRRQLASGKKHQPKFKIRKPGEGEDNAQWKKTYLLAKKKDEEEIEIEEIEEIEVLKEETRHNKKKVIDIDIRFNETFRGGDERGGGRRGGGRGGRSAGGQDDRRKRTQANGGGGQNLTNNRKQTAPKVDDINDFPSLGVAA